jgi:hypothetical protein
VTRYALAIFIVPIFALSAARPGAAPALQSPLATPAADRPSSPIASPGPAETAGAPVIPETRPAPPAGARNGLSPLVWVGVGLLLGSLVIFAFQRASPHER